jgi:hypothetical protein
MPMEQLSRLNIWADAGIRDFLISAGGTNWMWGGLRSRVGSLAKDYTDFKSLLPGHKSYDDFLAVDYRPEGIGRHVYVRYGDPYADWNVISEGDGNHVGTPSQVLDRFLTAIAFLQSRYYDGARDVRAVMAGSIDTNTLIQSKTFPSKVLGEDRKYGLVLPPGYDDPMNANERYPVMYFLHGQGMESDSLLASAILFFGYMAGSTNPDTVRRNESDWAKFILVFPDSHCQPTEECKTGNFNSNQPGLDGHGPHFQDMLYELMAYIEHNYRTAIPVEVPR